MSKFFEKKLLPSKRDWLSGLKQCRVMGRNLRQGGTAVNPGLAICQQHKFSES
jgi:hypothetical protein